MRIPKCADCRWFTGVNHCQHPDATLDPITGKDVERRTVHEMRFPTVTLNGGDYEMLGYLDHALCGMAARLFDLKVDPLRCPPKPTE